ncbi:phosphate metabolism protein 7 [Exophiala xenobiotica]|uniref:Phosphate metabolism protein 7 n=1 Tax=Lithohypha guttulata TaxID=1690604 RepID=A0ABR0JUQ5_9EURO|nr:phosphate metabolism protein 7 [Lithohypha guttulata]KAK5309512.1 phosphate metabolism protein 7 [Exophiala xenobiotica]
MSLNVSAIGDGKAQVLQPHSVRALLASLISASSMLGIALVAFLLMQVSPKLGMVISPPALLLHSKVPAVLQTFLQPLDRTVLNAIGIEAVMFLHYLRSFIACFNALASSKPVSNDWLNMLSWTNLSTKDVRLYWFYTAMTPLTVAVVLYFLSRGLTQAIQLRRNALTAEVQVLAPQRRRMYSVVVTNVPPQWDSDQVRACYSRWDHHIERVDRFSTDLLSPGGEVAQLHSIVRQIESSETSFINLMLRQFRHLKASDFRQHLMHEMDQRYSDANGAAGNHFGEKCASVVDLYSRLQRLTSSLLRRQSAPLRPDAHVSMLLTLNDYCAARAIADYPQSSEVSRLRARFLGASAADMVFANLGYTWGRHEAGRSLVRIVAAVLILGWTFPMAMVGGFSQLSVLLQLLPGQPLRHTPGWLVAAVQGLAPSVATSLLLSLFPWLLRRLLQLAKYPTHSQLQQATYQLYFCFLFLHLFLTASISSGLVPTAFAILNGGVTVVPRILAANLPLAGNYYLSYLLIQCTHMAASTLFRPLALFKLYQASRGGWTPRERMELMKDLFYWVRWGEIYPFYNVSFACATTTADLICPALTYALLTPFILPIATVTFGVTYVCFHHLLRDVSRVEAETRGQLYLRASFGLFWAIYTQQATIIGLFILKFDVRHKAHDLGQLTILLLTLFFSVQYHLSLKRLYGPLMRHQEGTISEPVHEGAFPDPLSDSDCVSSTDESTSIDQFLHCQAPVIWLPRDPAGISYGCGSGWDAVELTPSIHDTRDTIESMTSYDVPSFLEKAWVFGITILVVD